MVASRKKSTEVSKCIEITRKLLASNLINGNCSLFMQVILYESSLVQTRTNHQPRLGLSVSNQGRPEKQVDPRITNALYA